MSAIMGRRYTGPERAAIILLALGEDFGRPIWDELDDLEIRAVSYAMSNLGTVDASTVEQTVFDFSTRLVSGPVIGDISQTRNLLSRMLTAERVDRIMEEIEDLGDHSMWTRLSQTHETILANYIRNELPSTAAIVLGRLSPAHASKVLATLPRDFAVAVVDRMLSAEPVQRTILEQVEETIRKDFANLLRNNATHQSLERVVEIVSNLDSPLDKEILEELAQINEDGSQRVRSRLFTFADIANLDAMSLQTIISRTERELLARALKGSSELLRARFLAAMSTRAGTILKEAISGMRPLRLREVHQAQAEVVAIARGLELEGTVALAKKIDDPLVY